MRNLSIATVICSLFAAGFLAQDKDETQAAMKVAPTLVSHVPYVSTDVQTTQLAVLRSDVCTDGSCGTPSGASYSSQRWTPVRNVASRMSSRRSSGRWFLGKNLGRLFGRRR